ncbi:amidohydrolase family protein [Metarhizium robertsii]|uniref:Amidohydrolase n=2 Tax=Metarhizium robertsii TaxID=568076 RepID=E9ENA0_METRA|nr:amidohydrolase [Metarhizium robertsii ARSEF 23]EFZ03726.2 amidohydrolase [Metarhizium robertsii ARSEF 23]EXV02097.1 amidohydrolase family protein [Metarhizium robertsii]
MELKTITVHAGTIFDSKAKKFKENVSITVDPGTGSIVHVLQRDTGTANIREGDIDLRDKIVMPGFVDAHTHIFLHAYKERPSLEQMRDESIVERTIRATNHVRRALLSGYTTYRDLGTEGMASFDTNVRDAINRGLIPGPRLFVATECLASTGSYQLRSENTANGASGPRISDPCDGPVSCRAAVRRRVAAGADIIKFYADYSRQAMRFPAVETHGSSIPVQFPPRNPNPAIVMFNQDEMEAMVEEAHLAGLPVACHANTAEGAAMAAKAGVTSIEHGNLMTTEVFMAMQRSRTIFVPTLAVMEVLRKPDLARLQRNVRQAFDMGVRLAAGGDTGAFNHGEGTREMELMMEAGIPVEDVLEACMVGGWESCGKDSCGYRFGWFEEGNRADIIALDADPRVDGRALRKVSFVMKDGKVWKSGGVAVGVGE